MWTIVILFGGGGTLKLVFQDSQRALNLYEQLQKDRNPSDENYPPQVVVKDDFGTQAVIDIAEVIGHTLQDIAKVEAGSGELQLLTMKANIATQQRAQRKPALKLMMPAGGMIGREK